MTTALTQLTHEWGSREAVTMYLHRCQVDTPERVVEKVWKLIAARRQQIGKVVDFGAGDGRFSKAGSYVDYVGYEIDSDRSPKSVLPSNARVLTQCAFSDVITDADLCIGNPPYVRNQDLPEGWRETAASKIRQQTGVSISGLANAWQYFTFLALASTKDDGLVALVIPYEWVSRPSARALRAFVASKRWDVNTYRLRDETFHRVFTTSSILVVDKASKTGSWNYFEEDEQGNYKALTSASGSVNGPLGYSRGLVGTTGGAVRRGLSPGTQQVFTITETQRRLHKLRRGRDVVACVASLKGLPIGRSNLTANEFRTRYVESGERCWLIRSDQLPSQSLKKYLDSIPVSKRQTQTCLLRRHWWKFTMPNTPAVLVATGFRGQRPKIVLNSVGAVAVGAVSGIHNLSGRNARKVVRSIQETNLSSRIVTHANGLRKLESGQICSLVEMAMNPKLAPKA